jgi:hypothetical protein
MDLDRRRPRATVATAVLALATLVVLGPSNGSTEPTPDDLTGAAPVEATTNAAVAAADGPVAPDLPPVDQPPARRQRTVAAVGAATTSPGPGDDPEVPPPPPPAPTRTTDDGFEVLLGTSSSGTGPTVTFTVEVEPASGIAPAEALAVAEDALYDPRSWGRDVHLHRTDDPAEADIRLVFATPATTDRLCGAAGLRTHGVYSCWTGPYEGRFATVNSWRYAFGAAGFDDRDEYRRYVVNHEVGHGLGHGHVGCPAAGAPAPVMMQQSASLGACVANGWPYPDA